MLPEWQLAGGSVAFYIFDSVRLLYANEVVFHAGKDRWRYRMAGTRWLLLGRSVYVSNILTPHLPVVRATWTASTASDAGNPGNKLPSRNSSIEQMLALALLVAVAMIVPAVLVLLGNKSLLAALAFTYALILAQLAQIWLQRDKYMLATKKFWFLAADAVLCAPFAINTYRKLTMHAYAGNDALFLARHMLQPTQLEAFIDELVSQVDRHMQMYDEGDPMWNALGEYKAGIEIMRS